MSFLPVAALMIDVLMTWALCNYAELLERSS